MQSPPVVNHISMDRVQQLYSELPAIFAKEIQRRHLIPTATASPAAPNLPANSLKRDRVDDPMFDHSIHKRRDTGEMKMNPPPASAPSATPAVPPTIPPAVSQILPSISSQPTGLAGPPSMQPPDTRSPSMPPPSVPSGIMLGNNEQQIAANRARQMQMRAAAMQQQQPPQLPEANRQMSPPAQPGMAMPNGAGPSTMPNMPNMANTANVPNMPMHPTPQQLVAAFGPAALHNYQLLQNRDNPLVQRLHAQIPGFASLPLPAQLQKLQVAQVSLLLLTERLLIAMGGDTDFFSKTLHNFRRLWLAISKTPRNGDLLIRKQVEVCSRSHKVQCQTCRALGCKIHKYRLRAPVRQGSLQYLINQICTTRCL